MGLRGKSRMRNAAVIAALSLAVCAAHARKHDTHEKAQTLTDPSAGRAPVARIAVGPLGFLAPSPAYLNLRLAWASLNFIDPGHLLFTFHLNGLLQRMSDDDSSDGEDQMIRADVVDIATGKVVRQAEWRMRDRGRYLWPLRDGKFLVRERNELYLTDSSLELRPYLKFDTELQGVEVSPGRTMLMLEVEKFLESQGGGDDAPSLLLPAEHHERQRRTEMMLLRPGERTVLAKAELRLPIAVPLMEGGIAETRQGRGDKQWLIQGDTTGKTVQKIGEVKSDCAPQVQVLSRTVVLAQSCSFNSGSAVVVSALSLQGGVLWQDRWDSRYIWPSFDYAMDGSRFAYESMQANRDIGKMDSFGEQDIAAQPVGVFDTEAGKLVLVRNADPILSEGQNFALSADGRKFAILRNGAIEVYDLPAVAVKPVETAKKEKK